MSTTKLSTLFAAAALAGGVRVASAQPQAVHDQSIMHLHHHAQSSPATTSDSQKTIMPDEQGLRRTSIEEESPLDNKIELCRRHLATVEASAAAEADEAMGDGRTLSLLGGALRGKPSAAASNTATASRKPLQIDRRMLSEYGRQLEEANIGRVDGSGMDEKRKLNAQRSLFEVLYDFPECRCLEVEDCMSFIQKEHYNNDVPQFEARLVRNYDQANYNVVAIRPCDDGIHACGADGDGIVSYPFAWIVDGIGYSIGPWDCKTTGMHLTTEQCCDFIKSSVPLQDDRGRFLKCHITPESRLHPEADPNTIIIPFDPKTHSVAGVPYTN